jgi:hypothetical protein
MEAEMMRVRVIDPKDENCGFIGEIAWWEEHGSMLVFFDEIDPDVTFRYEYFQLEKVPGPFDLSERKQ